MNREGQFLIFYKDEYAFLTVYPPSELRGKVYPEDVIGRLKVLDIRNYRQQIVYDAVEESTGRPVRLAPWPEGKNLGPKINIEVDEDSMTARMTVTPGKQGGEPLSTEFLIRELEDKGIVFGINRNILDSIVIKKIFDQEVKVAFGVPPIHETAAEAEYTFLVDRGRPFKKLEFERIDLRELNFIQNKKKGSLLATLLDPLPPRDGKNIFGKLLPAKRGVTPPQFTAGAGAVLTEDGQMIKSLIDGNAKLDNGNVVVEPLITVENIDYSNGNIDFNGSVDISGRIADGFNVKAAGDIQIGKSISRVNIISGGDIILKAGISGNDEGTIVCGGDIYARYIESASIVCDGNVFVEEAIMHSTIKAGGDIILAGKRAEIFGDRIFASGSIRCKKIGSKNEPETEIFLGTSLKSFIAIEELQNVISKYSLMVDELDMQIRQIKNALKNNETKEVSIEKLRSALEQLKQESEAKNEVLNKNLRDLHELKKSVTLDETSILEAQQQIFGKVHIYFNHLRWDSPSKGTGKTSLIVKQGKLLEK